MRSVVFHFLVYNLISTKILLLNYNNIRLKDDELPIRMYQNLAARGRNWRSPSKYSAVSTGLNPIKIETECFLTNNSRNRYAF